MVTLSRALGIVFKDRRGPNKETIGRQLQLCDDYMLHRRFEPREVKTFGTDITLRTHSFIGKYFAHFFSLSLSLSLSLSTFPSGLPDFSYYMTSKPEKCTK
jgi:hypothetical protein